jgi:hypothetical protein
MKPERTFYRVAHETTGQGLWYDANGVHTGLIHGAMNFCKNRDLRMDPDPTLIGFLSATDRLETLFDWFTHEDILKLQEHGWFIHEYTSRDYWFYERFQHWAIDKATSVQIGILVQSANSTGQ